MQDDEGSLRLWAVDVAPHATPSLMAYQLFDFLTVGSFDPASGTYSVELEPIDGASTLSGTTTTTTPLATPPGPSGQAHITAAAGALSLPGHDRQGGQQAEEDVWGNNGLIRPTTTDSMGPPGRRVSNSSMASSSVAEGGIPGYAPSASALTHLPAPLSQRYFFAIDSTMHPAISSTQCSKFFHACWQEGLHYDVDHRVGVIFNLSDHYLLGNLGIITVGIAPQVGMLICVICSIITFCGRMLTVSSHALAW